ncbi:hypothetical protein EDB89DRAFT_1912881 [Lactarius sanguifluus]|nr:hypothetical protein EDB89DRAFT_1912881 [Lactarius sanguifluus]
MQPPSLQASSLELNLNSEYITINNEEDVQGDGVEDSIHQGVITRVGERTHEGNNLYHEMIETGIINLEVVSPSLSTCNEDQDVLLLIDNIFCFAQASKVVCSSRLYSLCCWLPTYALDRHGWHSTTTIGKMFKGSITSVQAVQVPANDLTDPAPSLNTIWMTTMTQPMNLLLFIDNIFCFAQASEVSALLGCIPSAVGYQPMLSTNMDGIPPLISLLGKSTIFCFAQASEVSALLGCIPSAVGYQPMLSTNMDGIPPLILLLGKSTIFCFTQASKVSALLGCIPSAVGYQPTLSTNMDGIPPLISLLGKSTMTIGKTFEGSITSTQAVQVPANDLTDPAPSPNTT